MELVEKEGLLVIMSGKQPMIKLLPKHTIMEPGAEDEMVKIPETKGK